MIPLLTIIILIACVILAFFILVQNPKGGGLSGSFGTMSTQVMGVKQSSDLMEKGTWILIGVVASICILSVMFMQRPTAIDNGKGQPQQKTAPAKKGK